MAISGLSKASKDLLERLGDTSLCGRVGSEYSLADAEWPSTLAKSWDEAIRVAGKANTIRFLTALMNEETNQICDGGRKKFGESFVVARYNPWTDKVREPIRAHIRRCVVSSSVPKAVRDVVSVQISSLTLGAVAAIEWREMMSTESRREKMIDVILDGHFLAGWEGAYPVGRLVIF